MKIAMRMILPVLGALVAFAHPAQARNYDCSKAGNANKAVCKTPAAPAAPAAPATKVSTERHYDCSKAGNANKTVCKGSVTTTAAAAPAPMPAPAPSARTTTYHRSVTTTTAKTTTAAGPSGATAQCKDGSYSHSGTRSGTCSHHGGVATWY